MRALALLALVALLAVSGSAAAHAVVQSATPPVNGRAPYGLQYVEVRFTEEVLRDVTTIDILDADLESVASGPVQFDDDDPSIVRRPVRELGDGIYTVNWRALSIDTHTTRGSFLFASGNANLVYAPPSGADPMTHSTEAVVKDGLARAGFFLGLFAVIGMPLFGLAVDRERPLPRHLLGAAGALALAGALSAGVMLLLFAQRTALAPTEALGNVAGAGIAWRGLLLALAGGLALLAAFAPGRARRNLAAFAILAGGAALVAAAMGSHAAAVTEQRVLSIAMDAAHLLMGAVWIGGVVAFLLVAWGRPAAEVGTLVARFTPLAIASVGIILVTGTYASLQHIPRLTDLWLDRYGRIVSLKLLLLVPLLALGWYHKERVGPLLRAGDASRPRAFRRALQVEAIVMVLIVSAAGILAASPPPAKDGPDAAATSPFHEMSNQTRTTHVIVQVSPNPVRVGLQNVTVILHSLTGPLPDATQVALKFQSPDERDEPETLVTPMSVGPGEWATGEDGIFTSPGTWKVHVILQRPDEYRKMVFDLEVKPASSAT